MSAITKKDIEHIALLARIKLTEKEEEKLTKDLGAILEYINKLNEVKTDEVGKIDVSKRPYEVFRKDETGNADFRPEPQELLAQVPDRKDDYIKVKGVFQESSNE
jgi:aspartyl-tRNA(Asn)/glutamyl-tRNA(Gln) amidotransferase subunit C